MDIQKLFTTYLSTKKESDFNKLFHASKYFVENFIKTNAMFKDITFIDEFVTDILDDVLVEVWEGKKKKTDILVSHFIRRAVSRKVNFINDYRKLVKINFLENISD